MKFTTIRARLQNVKLNHVNKNIIGFPSFSSHINVVTYDVTVVCSIFELFAVDGLKMSPVDSLPLSYPTERNGSS
jgi:hypothetical protein